MKRLRPWWTKLFRRIFGEGAFNAAFVPMFSKKFEAGEDPQGFARDAFSGLAFVLLILTALIAVYITLGVLYESYIHPITIISTLPSSLPS